MESLRSPHSRALCLVIMNKNIERIWHGFLTGIGISIALIIAIALVDQLFEDPTFGVDSGLEVTGFKERKTEYGIEIVGTVKNNSDETWGYVYVGINFFNAEGEFVDSYDSSIDGLLLPGKESYFKVVCGRNKSPLGNFKEYDVAVISAINAD